MLSLAIKAEKKNMILRQLSKNTRYLVTVLFQLSTHTYKRCAAWALHHQSRFLVGSALHHHNPRQKAKQSNSTGSITMKGFIAVVCLSLLVAVVNCQTEGETDNSMAATCEQVCDQVCDVCGQILTWTSGYVTAIEPYVETTTEYCLEGCAMGCSLLA
ncbi:hypothetical protein ElyMa_003650500 [Elysia marginata]|uniref:Saposin B-type domain-containing protein n=1 Tax=Elysia marginata TaxID=1093978 RepID=A0AAV4EWX0_9GAST|nr:hypothetical protein ElyMa_003650500 [Elysia marginata]